MQCQPHHEDINLIPMSESVCLTLPWQNVGTQRSVCVL